MDYNRCFFILFFSFHFSFRPRMPLCSNLNSAQFEVKFEGVDRRLMMFKMMIAGGMLPKINLANGGQMVPSRQ